MLAQSAYTIRGYHCDAYGHLNNARYLELFEDARWNLLDAGNIARPLKDKGLLFFVVSITINYRLPVNTGSRVEIRSSVDEISRKKIIILQEMYDVASGALCCDARIIFVLFDPTAERTITLTDEIVSLFKPFVHGQD